MKVSYEGKLNSVYRGREARRNPKKTNKKKERRETSFLFN